MGYLLPTIAMALPSPAWLSPDSKQIILVLWNVFPILVFAAVFVLSAIVPGPAITRALKANDGDSSATTKHLSSVRYLYAIVLAFSFAAHIAICAVSFSSVLFPAIWSEQHIADLSPATLFVPPMALPASQDFADGVKSFMMWDQVFGYATVGLAMLVQLRTASQGTPTGTIESVPGFEPAFKATVNFGADWLSFDPDGTHGRIDLKGMAK
ncbi:hypothetical protein F5Y15DRAFT_424989 [Xylariaceae sp. FL0016]|nr:hypothetical protein F5Y15DRAFT_424989 [Xylariaceae sp. FL0016]